MKYNRLGNTGLLISELTLGTMTFSDGKGLYGQVVGATGEEDAEAQIKMALDNGINFFDTANMYNAGQSEEILGKVLEPVRHDVHIATKVYFRASNAINDSGLSRFSIIKECERSLKRLGTDYIDLYQVHHFDSETALEETLSSLNDLIRAGKVRYIGLSNFSAWQIMKASKVAEAHNWDSFQTVQAYYSLAGRELEKEILPVVNDLGMGVLVWSPLAGGFLTGKFTREVKSGVDTRRGRFDYPPVSIENGYDIVDVLLEMAREKGVSVPQLSISWLLKQKGIASVIVGASKISQLEDNLGAVDVEFTDEDMVRLDKVSAMAPEYPHWMPEPDRLPDPEALQKRFGKFMK